MTKNEARARRLFRKIQLGHHYEWVNHYEVLHVLRVQSKRLTVGKDPCVEVSGVFFFLHGKTSEPCGEGLPAGSHEWNEVGPVFRKWKGTTPKRSPLHTEWYCLGCDREILFAGTTSSLLAGTTISLCCHCSIYKKQIYKGEHDDTCLCEECGHEVRS